MEGFIGSRWHVDEASPLLNWTTSSSKAPSFENAPTLGLYPTNKILKL